MIRSNFVDAPVPYVTAFLQLPYYVTVGKRCWFVFLNALVGRRTNQLFCSQGPPGTGARASLF